jgi:hypothetical protein
VKLGTGPSWAVSEDLPTDLNVRYFRRRLAQTGAPPEQFADGRLLGLPTSPTESDWWDAAARDRVEQPDPLDLPVQERLSQAAARLRAVEPISVDERSWIETATSAYNERNPEDRPRIWEIVQDLAREEGVAAVAPFRFSFEIILIDAPWFHRLSPKHALVSLGLFRDHDLRDDWLRASLRPLVG